MIRPLLLLALVAASLPAILGAAGTLVSVQVLHRHGDRAPTSIMPALAKQWEAARVQKGQLSTVGRAQTLAFGHYLAQQYQVNEPLIGTQYEGKVVDDIYVRSTDYDRCLLSGQYVVSGLFKDSTLLPPVHMPPQGEMDSLLQPYDKCPSYRAAEGVWAPELDEQWAVEHKGFLQKLKDITLWKDKYAPTRLMEVAQDNIVCGWAHNFQMDPWLSEAYPLIRNLTLEIGYRAYAFDQQDKRGPVAGELLRKVATNFDLHTKPAGDKTNDDLRSFPRGGVSLGKEKDVKRKVTLYSAHDTTVLALYAALGLLTPQHQVILPPYVVNLIFELRKTDDGVFHINAKYGYIKQVDGATALDDPASWQYTGEDVLLPCPTAAAGATQCPFDKFLEYVRTAAPVPAEDSGCCLRNGDFAKNKCDAYTTEFENLPENCQMYRVMCPLTSCGDDQYVSGSDLSCEVYKFHSTQEADRTWKFIGIAALVAIPAIIFLAVVCRPKPRRGEQLENGLLTSIPDM